jgi:hypothetical protein
MLKMPLYGISLFYLPLSAVAGVALRLDRGCLPPGNSRLLARRRTLPALATCVTCERRAWSYPTLF